MRLFIGVFLPSEVSSHLAARLRASPPLPQLKWIDPSSLHVTLKLIGQAPDENTSIFQSVLDRVAGRHKTFKIWCEGGGVFPNQKNPRVFWTGLSGEVELLKRVAGNLEQEFSQLGFPPENRRFSPHLTLARVGQAEPPVEEFTKIFS